MTEVEGGEGGWSDNDGGAESSGCEGDEEGVMVVEGGREREKLGRETEERDWEMGI